jgi:hypothetical protein
MINVKRLSADELHQLATILNSCMKKSRAAEVNLEDIVQKVKGLSEDSFAFVWDNIPKEHHNLLQIPNCYEVAQNEKVSIEKEFSERRVRRVHYRKQAMKVLKEYDTGMLKVIAYCADHDFPVECYKMPRCFPHYDVLNSFYNQVGASKQLLKSKYFPSYLGFDDVGEEAFNLYFFEIKKGKALELLLSQTGRAMKDEQHLFRFWAKELLYAFKDLTYRSTYTVTGDISLRNVYVSDLGIKVYLKKIKYGELRDDNLKFHLSLEAKMLGNYARILISMLRNDPTEQSLTDIDDVLSHLRICPELKAILYECLHAKDKVEQSEQDEYDNETRAFILQEQMKRVQLEQKNHQGGLLEESDFADLLKFKEQVEEERQEEAKNVRTKPRKGKDPQMNARDFKQENVQHGVTNEVDLVLQRIAGHKTIHDTDDEYVKAQGYFSRQLFDYSQTLKSVKQKKDTKYLTVQSLLDHPYFLNINNADISTVIDEYEELQKVLENQSRAIAFDLDGEYQESLNPSHYV